MIIVFLIVNWPLEIAHCQDENEETVEICTSDWPQDSRAAGWENCLTLQQYINRSRNFSSEGILFRLLPGRHTLNGTDRLVISGTNFTMVSDEDAILDCSGSDNKQHNVVFLDNGAVEINSTNVIGCRFYFSDIDTIAINGGYFHAGVDNNNNNNNITISQHPAIAANGSSTVTIRRWSCLNYEGGCLDLSRTSLLLSDSNFTNNSNTAVRIVDSSPVRIKMCSFSINRGKNGGAINALGAAIFIECSTFNNNVAISNGGVIYVDQVNLEITSSTFSNNFAGKNGGVLFVIRAEVDVFSSTLSNSTAIISGGAGYVREGSIFTSQTNFLSNKVANGPNTLAICDATIRIMDYNQQEGETDPNDSTCMLYDGDISLYQNDCGPDITDVTIAVSELDITNNIIMIAIP